MLILGQSMDKVVNLDMIIALTIYRLGDWEKGKEIEKKFRILAWSGNGEGDCFGLGDYATEERCKEIIFEIHKKCGEYIHRPYSPAVLRGTSDIPEMLFVPPKVYEMPEV